MRLEHLEVRNWCQHAERQLSLSSGLTAVLGSNGSGKSNLLGAIRLALTGVNLNVGKAEQNIRQQAGETEKSYVRLRFSHAGVTATVTRYLRPARPTATLEITGRQPIQGAEAVTAAIVEVLGLTPDILNEIVLVAQSDIFGFLDKTPAARDAVFQRLFRTEKAKQVYDAVSVSIRLLQVPTLGVAIDVLEADTLTASGAAVNCQETLDRMPTHDEAQKQRDAHLAVDQAFTRRQAVSANVVKWIGEQARLEEQQRLATATLANRDQAVVLAGNAVQLLKPAMDKANALLATQQQQQHQERQRIQLQQQRDAAKASLDALVPPQLPIELQGFSCELAQQQQQELQARITYYRTLVETFKDGIAACPVCHTPTTALAEHITTAQTQLPQLLQEFQTRGAQIGQVRAYEQQRDGHGRQVTERQARLTDAESALASCTVSTVVDADEARRVLLEFESRVLAHSKAQQEHTAVAAQLQNIAGQLRQASAAAEGATTELATIPNYTEEQATQSRGHAEGWSRVSADRRQAEQQLAAANSRLQELTRQLQTAKQQQATAERDRRWQLLLAGVQAVVHASALPRFVSQRNLERLEGVINDHLGYFETDFRIRATDGLSFEARFTDGRRQPAERLSAGQQVVLALAFRLALNLLTADNIGVLVLDEPTAYLDEHHIRGFEPVLTRLRELSSSRGLQCLMVTHEQSLAPLFDSVIRLDQPT